jgi:hypothetical protein
MELKSWRKVSCSTYITKYLQYYVFRVTRLNVHAWNVLVTFCQPRNIHPMQRPMFTTSTVKFCLQMNVQGFYIRPPNPGGGHNVAVTKRPPFFLWIVTKHPLCEIFPACFMTSLFPYCDFLSHSYIAT